MSEEIKEQETEQGDEEVRVKLGDLHIGPSVQTDAVYIGVIADTGTEWGVRVDRSKEFALAAVMWIGVGNSRLLRHPNGKYYRISVTEHSEVEEVDPKIKQ